MKFKAFALSVALLAGVLSANAQTQKCGKDVFVGVGAGVSSVMTPGFSTPAVYANLMVGKYISPVWGVRAVIGGPFQTVDPAALTFNDSAPAGFNTKKLFGEINLDAMFSFTNLGNVDLAKLDVYAFAGPTVNFSTAGSRFTGEAFQGGLLVEEDDSFKARFGATVGLGLAYNITKTFALGLEGRVGVTPSIFGDADQYRKGEATSRLAINGVWTIGGRRGKAERVECSANAAGYLSAAAAAAAIAKALDENPKIVEKVVEKEVVKEVVKEVAVSAPASTAVFFSISKYNIAAADKARLKLFADDVKAGDKNQVYVVTGYADKATGSARTNQVLSEKRAKAVYDALIAEGVPASQLEIDAKGGVGPMFFNNIALSRTAIVAPKN